MSPKEEKQVSLYQPLKIIYISVFKENDRHFLYFGRANQCTD